MTRSTQVLRAVAGTGLAVLLAAAATGAGAPTGAPPSADRSVVVTARQGRTADLAGLVRAAGGTVGRRLPLVDGLSARVPADRLARLAADPAVRSVTPDASMTVTATSWGGSPLASSYPLSAGADAAWRRGSTGAGVTVAVLDTGVSPVPDLAGRVVAGPDLSGERGSTHDSYGHGTVMAGLVAGDGVASRGAPGRCRTSAWRPRRRWSASRSPVVRAPRRVDGPGRAAVGRHLPPPATAPGSSTCPGAPPRASPPSLDPLDFAVERLWAGASSSSPPPATPDRSTARSPSPATTRPCSPSAPTTRARAVRRPPTWSRASPAAAAPTDGKPDLVAPGPHAGQHRRPAARSWRSSTPRRWSARATSRAAAPRRPPPPRAAPWRCCFSARPAHPDQVKHLLRTTAARLPAPRAHRAGPRAGAPLDAALGAAGRRAPQRATGHRPRLARGQPRRAARQTTCPGSTSRGSLRPSWSSASWPHTAPPTPGRRTRGARTPGRRTAGRADSWSADSWSADSWSADSWSADSWSADSWRRTPGPAPRGVTQTRRRRPRRRPPPREPPARWRSRSASRPQVGLLAPGPSSRRARRPHRPAARGGLRH